MQNNLTQHFIRYAVIYALIQIIYTILLYLIGADFIAAHFILVPLFSILIAIVFTIISISNFRKSNGNYLTFQEGFKVTFFMLAVAGLIGTLFGIIFYGFIAKEFSQEVTEKTLLQVTEWMEKLGASQEDIDKAMERSSDSGEQYTIGGQIRGYLFMLLIYGIYSVILAAIFKRNKPPFEEQPAP
jgi:hypothetical protein